MCLHTTVVRVNTIHYVLTQLPQHTTYILQSVIDLMHRSRSWNSCSSSSSSYKINTHHLLRHNVNPQGSIDLLSTRGSLCSKVVSLVPSPGKTCLSDQLRILWYYQIRWHHCDLLQDSSRTSTYCKILTRSSLRIGTLSSDYSTMYRYIGRFITYGFQQISGVFVVKN